MIPNAPEEWNYLLCCKNLNIETLEKRRIANGLTFAAKSIQEYTDSQQYKFLFKFNEIPSYCTRRPRKFILHASRTDVGLNSPINILMLQANTYCNDLDIFNDEICYFITSMKANVTLQYKPTFE